MFTYISDLPPQIQAVLDVKLQELWLQSFNATYSVTANEAESYQTAWLKVFQSAFPGEIGPIPQMRPPTGVGQVATSGSSGTMNVVGSAVTPTPMLASDVVLGYWVDLRSVELADSGVTWLQAMPLGTYDHPVHGKINITPDRVAQFAQNVKANVRGTELDIDYDHKERTGEAAGWIKDAQARPNGLWIAVEWTKDALNKVKNKAYRYFSPEFADTWTHPKTGAKYKNVLFGGALTNRPFLKDILPINMAEVMQSQRHNEGDSMKEIAKLLGLPEDAAEDAILDALKTRNEKNPDDTEPEEEGAAPTGEGDEEVEPEEARVAANEKIINDPAVKLMSDRIAILEGALRLSEVNNKLNEITTEGKFAIAPAVLDDVKTLALEAPKQFADKVLDLVSKIAQGGVVELGERGRVGGTESGATATKQFSDKIEAVMKDRKIDYSEASNIVASENPALFDEYRKESFVREAL